MRERMPVGGEPVGGEPVGGEQQTWAQALDVLWARTRDSQDDVEAPKVWTPPVGLGPLPPEQRRRAESILESQRLAIAAVRRRMDEVADELNTLRAAPALATPAVPVYLDCLG